MSLAFFRRIRGGRWLTAFSTGWFKTPIASRCAAIRCVGIGGKPNA